MYATKTERPTSNGVTEHLPTAWVDERDVPFFRITANLFAAAFVNGAGVLLASYDAIAD